MSDRLDTKQFSHVMGITPRMAEKWRNEEYRGPSPMPKTQGRRVFYDAEVVRDYLEKRREAALAEYAERMRILESYADFS